MINKTLYNKKITANQKSKENKRNKTQENINRYELPTDGGIYIKKPLHFFNALRSHLFWERCKRRKDFFCMGGRPYHIL